MKAFLFLYPLREFIEAIPKKLPRSFRAGVLKLEDLDLLDRMIRIRYREHGYRVFWAFYGQEGNLIQPDQQDRSERFDYFPEDGVISTGCVTGEPDFALVYDQLVEFEELVIGGFHWMSCVAFMAEYGRKVGRQCRVDEDLTNAFFSKLQNSRQMLSRELNLEGETVQPWMFGDIESQLYYAGGMIARPWLFNDPPLTSFFFEKRREFREFSREEVMTLVRS